MTQLVLYTRAGCCLCEGLEERLRQLSPPPPLRLVDIDADPALAGRYGLTVPVLAVEASPPPSAGVPAEEALRELPRVPPRLAGEALRAWLHRHGAL